MKGLEPSASGIANRRSVPQLDRVPGRGVRAVSFGPVGLVLS